MRIDDIARLNLGTFVRPAEETDNGHLRVETVLGYVAKTPTSVTAPLPTSSPWMSRLLAFDPKRVLFAHDMAVWTP